VPSELLFVYGTLMRGFPPHHVLARGARFVGRGTVSARLFDLGPYPAAIPATDGAARGEVYRVTDVARWRALDSAEGPQYHRGETTARLDTGEQIAVQIYWYRGPLGQAVAIPHGDYRGHAPAGRLHHEINWPGGAAG
jgi:gamma-glutamylcyclotransferase (GGCT)/AIG2-like uncharacterized protein YtfP